jgi:hypothetical protein
MSRGLGRIECEVLRWLRTHDTPYTWLDDLRTALCPPWPSEPAPTEKLNEERARWAIRQYLHSLPVLARHEAVNRAVRSLARKGLVRTGKDIYGRRHRKAVWLADREAPCMRKDGIYSR